MTVHDTLRWGDVETLVIHAAVGEIPTLTSKQLASAHWRWPLTWTVLLPMTAMLEPAETADVIVTIEYTVGVGQAMVTYTEDFTITHASGYAPLSPQRFIPAQDIQIRAFVTTSKTPTGLADESVQVGCMIAPMTEPHAMTELLEHEVGIAQKEVEWMQNQPFTAEPLEYGPRFRR
jgi:hypothetical protein